jgi:NADH-quinone oxidoreductase subunit N
MIIALSTPENPVETVDDLSGLAASRPWSALGLAICLFSLAGIPPLLGFWGKFQIFWAAIAAASGDDPRRFKLLAVIGMLNAAVGAYYYLRIIVGMYLRPATRTLEPRAGWPTLAAATTCVVLTLGLGLFSRTLTIPCQDAARAAVELELPRSALAVTASPSSR